MNSLVNTYGAHADIHTNDIMTGLKTEASQTAFQSDLRKLRFGGAMSVNHNERTQVQNFRRL